MYGGKGEEHTGFWWGNLLERDCIEDLWVGRMVILKFIFNEMDKELVDCTGHTQ